MQIVFGSFVSVQVPNQRCHRKSKHQRLHRPKSLRNPRRDPKSLVGVGPGIFWFGKPNQKSSLDRLKPNKNWLPGWTSRGGRFQVAAKAKGRLGRAKLAQMLVGDMMKDVKLVASSGLRGTQTRGTCWTSWEKDVLFVPQSPYDIDHFEGSKYSAVTRDKSANVLRICRAEAKRKRPRWWQRHLLSFEDQRSESKFKPLQATLQASKPSFCTTLLCKGLIFTVAGTLQPAAITWASPHPLPQTFCAQSCSGSCAGESAGESGGESDTHTKAKGGSGWESWSPFSWHTNFKKAPSSFTVLILFFEPHVVKSFPWGCRVEDDWIRGLWKSWVLQEYRLFTCWACPPLCVINYFVVKLPGFVKGHITLTFKQQMTSTIDLIYLIYHIIYIYKSEIYQSPPFKQYLRWNTSLKIPFSRSRYPGRSRPPLLDGPQNALRRWRHPKSNNVLFAFPKFQNFSMEDSHMGDFFPKFVFFADSPHFGLKLAFWRFTTASLCDPRWVLCHLTALRRIRPATTMPWLRSLPEVRTKIWASPLRPGARGRPCMETQDLMASKMRSPFTVHTYILYAMCYPDGLWRIHTSNRLNCTSSIFRLLDVDGSSRHDQLLGAMWSARWNRADGHRNNASVWATLLGFQWVTCRGWIKDCWVLRWKYSSWCMIGIIIIV